MDKIYTEEAKVRIKTIKAIFIILIGIVTVILSGISFLTYSSSDLRNALGEMHEAGAPDMTGMLNSSIIVSALVIVFGIAVIIWGIKIYIDRKNIAKEEDNIDIIASAGTNDSDIEEIANKFGYPTEKVNVKRLSSKASYVIVFLLLSSFLTGTYFSAVSLKKDLDGKALNGDVFSIAHTAGEAILTLFCLFMSCAVVYALIKEINNSKKNRDR